MMTTTMLTMMTKATAKMALAMNGGSRGGQQMRQWWGLSVHIFYQN
jgi:hypothetical protein